MRQRDRERNDLFGGRQFRLGNVVLLAEISRHICMVVVRMGLLWALLGVCMEGRWMSTFELGSYGRLGWIDSGGNFDARSQSSDFFFCIYLLIFLTFHLVFCNWIGWGERLEVNEVVYWGFLFLTFISSLVNPSFLMRHRFKFNSRDIPRKRL